MIINEYFSLGQTEGARKVFITEDRGARWDYLQEYLNVIKY